ncbi:MAG: TCP-1/cpn60 chaperonin family protein [Fimbriimonadales bacterium]
MEEGIVPGGGIAPCSTAPRRPAWPTSWEGDEQIGSTIVRKAIEALRTIAENAGVEGSVVVEKVKEGKAGIGFNAATLVYEDLVKAGVVDPTKVVRTTLQTRFPSRLLLVTEACRRDSARGRRSHHAGHHHH